MFYLTAKFQKNLMNGLEDISGRTYARTHGRDSLGLKRLRRETKNGMKIKGSYKLIMQSIIKVSGQCGTNTIKMCIFTIFAQI